MEPLAPWRISGNLCAEFERKYVRVARSAAVNAERETGEIIVSKKRAPRVRGQSALVLSCVRAFESTLLLIRRAWLRRSPIRGGLRGTGLRRAGC
jgi:hypothetical protein